MPPLPSFHRWLLITQKKNKSTTKKGYNLFISSVYLTSVVAHLIFSIISNIYLFSMRIRGAGNNLLLRCTWSLTSKKRAFVKRTAILSSTQVYQCFSDSKNRFKTQQLSGFSRDENLSSECRQYQKLSKAGYSYFRFLLSWRASHHSLQRLKYLLFSDISIYPCFPMELLFNPNGQQRCRVNFDSQAHICTYITSGTFKPLTFLYLVSCTWD